MQVEGSKEEKKRNGGKEGRKGYGLGTGNKHYEKAGKAAEKNSPKFHKIMKRLH